MQTTFTTQSNITGGAVNGSQLIPYGFLDSGAGDDFVMEGNVAGNLEKMWGVVTDETGTDDGIIYEYTKDPITKNYTYNQQVTLPGSGTFSIANLYIEGTNLYVIVNHSTSGIVFLRYDATDITATPTTFTPSTTIVGSQFIVEGNDVWIVDSVASSGTNVVFDLWTISGSNLTKTVTTKTIIVTSLTVDTDLRALNKIEDNLYVSYITGTPGTARIAIYDFTTSTQLESKNVFGFSPHGTQRNVLIGFNYGGGEVVEYVRNFETGRGTDYDVSLCVEPYSIFQ